MICQKCGKDNFEGAQYCAGCGAAMSAEARPSGPLKTHPMAIWSLVLSIVGCFTCVAAIPGLILGIVGLNRINARRDQLTGQGLAIAGIAIASVALVLNMLIMPAILFPVFARAREAARKAKCLNNLKQCSQALKLYSDDYDGNLPSSKIGGVTTEQFCSMTSVGGNYPPKGGEPRKTWPQLLSDHMKTPDIVFCPSDSVGTVDASNKVASYWYKYSNDLASTQRNQTNMSDYGYESDQAAFFEHAGWHFGDSAGLKQGIQISIAYMDTHVETDLLPSDGTAPPANAPVNDPAGMKGPYEPFYYNTTFVNGRAAPATGSLTPDIGTGAYVDPSRNYDTF